MPKRKRSRSVNHTSTAAVPSSSTKGTAKAEKRSQEENEDDVEVDEDYEIDLSNEEEEEEEADWDIDEDNFEAGSGQESSEAESSEEADQSSSSGEQENYIEADSSDEEIAIDENTVGDVPMHWYEDYDHIGYNIEGERIARPEKKDQLDSFLESQDGNRWRRVWDEKNQREIVLTDREMAVLRNIQKGRFPDPEYDAYQPLIEFDDKDAIHPVTNDMPPKSRFVPSKWEAKKIAYLSQAIRKGWIKIDKEDKKKEPQFFMLWDDSEQVDKTTKRWNMHIPAPRLPLPGHNESYRPPSEYLMNEEEKKAWEMLDPEDRPFNFIPQSYDCLRRVPFYNNTVHERFNRCLDLYLCPRVMKKRQNVDPDSLLPKLPDPSELRPFPTKLSMRYEGHTGRIISLQHDPLGQWIVSGSDDFSVRIWEVYSGRCMAAITLPERVRDVAWNPNPSTPVVLAAAGKKVYIINPTLGDLVTTATVDANLAGALPSATDVVSWTRPDLDGKKSELHSSIRLVIVHKKEVEKVVWHKKGDYFASVCSQATKTAVLVHRLSQKQTQVPFKRNKDAIQAVAFHPNKPFFFVASQRYVRVYNLLRQQLLKKLQPGVQWISSMSIHPNGDNLIIGTYDKKVCWFDLDYSSKPYRVLRYHTRAVRDVQYHQRYPLFATCSDDGTTHVFHGTVYDDYIQNPLLVPLKILKGHEINSDLGVLCCEFHPTQPWITSGGADGKIFLYV